MNSSDPLGWTVLVASPTRLYQFVGGPSFEALFATYEQSPLSFIELPGAIRRSDLHVVTQLDESTKCAWMTGWSNLSDR